MSAVHQAGGLAMVGLFLIGAGASQRLRPRPEPPVFRMHTDRIGLDPGCPQGAPPKVSLTHGKAPTGVHKIALLTISADSPQELTLLERALIERAQEHCADGINILQATAEPGALGISEVRALVWSHDNPTVH